MINESKLRDAVFWDERAICLECGEVNEYHATECEECGSDKVVSPQLAILVLDNVVEGS